MNNNIMNNKARSIGISRIDQENQLRDIRYAFNILLRYGVLCDQQCSDYYADYLYSLENNKDM